MFLDRATSDSASTFQPQAHTSSTSAAWGSRMHAQVSSRPGLEQTGVHHGPAVGRPAGRPLFTNHHHSTPPPKTQPPRPALHTCRRAPEHALHACTPCAALSLVSCLEARYCRPLAPSLAFAPLLATLACLLARFPPGVTDNAASGRLAACIAEPGQTARRPSRRRHVWCGPVGVYPASVRFCVATSGAGFWEG